MYQLEIFTNHMLNDGSYDSISVSFSTLEELLPTAKLFIDQGYIVQIDNPAKISENPYK
jgi:hypothetical protein